MALSRRAEAQIAYRRQRRAEEEAKKAAAAEREAAAFAKRRAEAIEKQVALFRARLEADPGMPAADAALQTRREEAYGQSLLNDRASLGTAVYGVSPLQNVAGLFGRGF